MFRVDIINVHREKMLGAFEFRVDDYVGRRMVVGFVVCTAECALPSKISKNFDMDGEGFDTPAFHNKLKSMLGNDSLSSGPFKFGFYRNDVTNADPQHDGTVVPVEMDLKLKMDVEFEANTFNRFITNGNLNEDDPAVLTLRMTNPCWLDESKTWGWSIADIGNKDKDLPSGAEILVEMDRDPCLSFIYPENGYWFSPTFSDFEVL